MELYLVRHGESEANVANLINDDPSIPVNLTKRGIAQAQATSELLRNVRFTYAYASEFPRARQTAEILIHVHDIQLTIDSRLNERRSGMNGMPVQAFQDLISLDPLRTKPPRGESFVEQMERLKSFLDHVATRHVDGTLLVVSHENPIIAALALTVEDPGRVVRSNLDNCAWVKLDWGCTNPIPVATGACRDDT